MTTTTQARAEQIVLEWRQKYLDRLMKSAKDFDNDEVDLVGRIAAELLRQRLELLKIDGWLERWLIKVKVGCYSLHKEGECEQCDFWRDIRKQRADLERQLKELEP